MNNRMITKLAIFVILITLLLVGCGTTKTVGMGTPVANSLLEVTVNKAHIEEELVSKNGVQKPPESTTIIMVDVHIRVLEEVQKAEINLGEIAIRGSKDELLYGVRGFGSSAPGEPIWLENSFQGFSITLDADEELDVSLVFLVNDDAIEQTFKFKFLDMKTVQLTINGE